MIGTPSQYSKLKMFGEKNPDKLEKGEYFLRTKEGSLWVKLYNNTFVIRNVFVSPDHRNKGVGTKMVQDILSHLKPKGKDIFLYVDPLNTPAVSVYKKLGFKLIKQGAVFGDKYQYKE